MPNKDGVCLSGADSASNVELAKRETDLQGRTLLIDRAVVCGPNDMLIASKNATRRSDLEVHGPRVVVRNHIAVYILRRSNCLSGSVRHIDCRICKARVCDSGPVSILQC